MNSQLLSCLIVGCVLVASRADAQDQRILFQSRPDVTLRQKNRLVVRGALISVDEKQAAVVVPVAGGYGTRVVNVGLDKIVRLRTTDGRFQLKPSDDFAGIAAAAAQLPDVTIVRVDADGNPIDIDDPEDSSDAGNTGGFGSPPLVNGGFGQPSANGGFGAATPSEAPPFSPVANPDSSVQPIPNTPPGGTSPLSLDDPTETVICGNCNQEVAVTAEYGQKCPHCGIEWAIPVAVPVTSSPQQIAAGSPIDAPPELARELPGGQPIGLADGAQNVPAGVPPPSLQAPQVPMTAATLPVWMKAAFFFGAIGAVYYVMFYRR